jgi:hypothetical protein
MGCIFATKASGANQKTFQKLHEHVISWVNGQFISSKSLAVIMAGLEKLELPDPTQPARPDPNVPGSEYDYKVLSEQYHDTLRDVTNFKSQLYRTVLGQCTPPFEAQVRSHADFEAASHDGIALLIIVKTLLLTDQSNRYPPEISDKMKKAFYAMKMRPGTDLTALYKEVEAMIESLNESGIEIADPGTALEIARAAGRNEPNDDDKQAARQAAGAVRYLDIVHEARSEFRPIHRWSPQQLARR